MAHAGDGGLWSGGGGGHGVRGHRGSAWEGGMQCRGEHRGRDAWSEGCAGKRKWLWEGGMQHRGDYEGKAMWCCGEHRDGVCGAGGSIGEGQHKVQGKQNMEHGERVWEKGHMECRQRTHRPGESAVKRYTEWHGNCCGSSHDPDQGWRLEPELLLLLGLARCSMPSVKTDPEELQM